MNRQTDGEKEEERRIETMSEREKSATKFTNNYYNFFTPQCNQERKKRRQKKKTYTKRRKQNADSVWRSAGHRHTMCVCVCVFFMGEEKKKLSADKRKHHILVLMHALFSEHTNLPQSKIFLYKYINSLGVCFFFFFFFDFRSFLSLVSVFHQRVCVVRDLAFNI